MSAKIKANVAYYLPVSKVFYKTSFNGAQGTRYVFKVHFVDKELNEYITEYLSLTRDQNIFVEGNMVRFKLFKDDDVIVPLEGTQETETQILDFQFRPISGETYTFAMAAAKDLMIAQIQARNNVSCETIKMQPVIDAEESAIDHRFKLKEWQKENNNIYTNPPSEITEADITQMFTLADRINKWYEEKQMNRAIV